MNRLPKYKLRFFFDNGAGGCLWGGNDLAYQDFGIGPLDETIKEKTGLISDKIFAEIDQIDKLHATYLNKIYPPDPSLWTQEKCDHFNHRVNSLLDELRRELTDDFEIVDNQERYNQDPDLEKYLADPKNFKRTTLSP